MCLLNNSIRFCVSEIRNFKYKVYDKLISEVTNSLYNLKGVICFEDITKDQVVFALPLTNCLAKIIYPEKGYSLTGLLKLISEVSITPNKQSYETLIRAITNPMDSERLLHWYNKSTKSRIKNTLCYKSGEKISLSLVKNVYLCSHYNSADLSILDDFTTLKQDLNIVGKSFVTLGKPLKISGVNLYIRDTMLLTPGSLKSLDSVGKLYESEGGYNKIEIPLADKQKMSSFLERDKVGFEEYALIDAKIVLRHANAMEMFNFSNKQLGIPITLSSLGRNFVIQKWKEEFESFFPYQISGECLMGNADEVQTPKGLFATGDVGLHLSYYIGNYKGGRNESFMYGSENNIEWFDYDLSSAYTTGMSHLTLPAYNRGGMIDPSDVEK